MTHDRVSILLEQTRKNRRLLQIDCCQVSLLPNICVVLCALYQLVAPVFLEPNTEQPRHGTCLRCLGTPLPQTVETQSMGGLRLRVAAVQLLLSIRLKQDGHSQACALAQCSYSATRARAKLSTRYMRP